VQRSTLKELVKEARRELEEGDLRQARRYGGLVH